MKVFYHNDADGKAAANVVHRHRPGGQKPEDFFEITYGIPFPFDIISKGEEVWIVDYSIEPEEMEKLLGITENVTWIDHHITSIEKYKDFPHKIEGWREDGIAGCLLTWMYLWDVQDYHEAPKALQYIGDRDVWKWEFGDESKNFFSGAELSNLDPLSEDWEELYDHPDQIMLKGETVEKYKSQRNKLYIKEFGHVVEFEGMKAQCINIGQVDSSIFDSIDPDYKTPLYIMYVFNGKFNKVSLRSEGAVDVAKIAQKYGGGGHKQASGFECQELPWK